MKVKIPNATAEQIVALNRLYSQLERYRKALEFYADEDTWNDQLKWIDECCADILPSLAEDDFGAKAREALKEIK